MTMQFPWRVVGEPLVLASGSRTRAALLTSAGIPFEVRPASIDERAVEASLTESRAPAAGVAAGLALAKARAVAPSAPGRLVLGADQVLEYEGGLMHKPADRAAAAGQLSRLAGRRHRLHSAAVLIRDDRPPRQITATAELTMRPLSADLIDAYLDAAGEAVLGSVGCYQIEGFGIHLFSGIAGEHSVILGLPMMPLLAALRAEGALC